MTTRPNPVRERLRAGGNAFGVMAFEFFTPGLAPVLAASGAEFVLLDMEHSGAGIDTIKAHGTFVFNGISIVIRGMVNGLTTLLRALPALVLIAAVALLAWVLRRSWTLTAFVALARWLAGHRRRCRCSAPKMAAAPAISPSRHRIRGAENAEAILGYRNRSRARALRSVRGLG